MALAPDIAKSIVNDLLTTGRSSWDQLGEKYGQENVDGVLKIFSQQKTR